MKRYLKVLLFCSLMAVVPFLEAGCGAAPPSPPIELPSPLVLHFAQVEEISIDVSSIALEGSAASISRAVGAGGQYATEIAIGAETSVGIGKEISFGPQTLAVLQIPVDATIRTFQTDAIFQDGSVHTFKIDFADFDFNGDGVEGCSGHTAMLPVCARIWMDGERLAQWVFDEYATDVSPGKSRYRFQFADASGDPIFAAVDFDHRNAEDKYTEIFFKTSGGDDPQKFSTIKAHLKVTQLGPDAAALKSVGISSDGVATIVGQETEGFFRYVGQFREGEDFWSGSVLAKNTLALGIDPLQTFSNLCAQISTGDAAADQRICEINGISTEGTPFVRSVVDADVEFVDFPETPTF